MPLEMEAPEQIEQPAVKLFAEPPAAAEAATLLDGPNSDSEGMEPQREGAERMTIRLTKDVADEPAKFAGTAGETFDAYVDSEGNTWLPLATNDIMLEAEEFEIVEPLTDDEAALKQDMDEVARKIGSDDESATPQEIAQLVDAVAAEIVKEEAAATAATPEPTPAAAPTAATPAIPRQPAIPRPPVDDYAARRRDYLRQKDILQEQIAALMIEQAKLKEQVKRAKKEAEVYVEQLNELIDGWEHPAQLENEPPTEEAATRESSSIDAGGSGGQPPVCQTDADQAAKCEPQPEPAGTPEPQPSNSMSTSKSTSLEQSYESELRAAGLGELKLPGSLHEKLTDAGVNTIWDLERLRGEISQGREKWPKGIGAAKITTIEDAVLGWLTRNQSRWEKPQAVTVAEPEKASQAEQVQSLDSDLDDL